MKKRQKKTGSTRPAAASADHRARAARGDLPQPDFRRAEQLVLRMMAIPGASGQEGRVAEFVADRLRRAGVADSAIEFDRANLRSPAGGETGNLVCRLPGTRRGGRRLLMAHLDTVPLCVGVRPVVRGNYVVPADKNTALGADDRAGASVVLATALEVLRRRLPHPPLVFLWTVQEEVGLQGASHLRLGMLAKPRLAFNFDGGSPEKLTVGATGGYRMLIHVKGVASHAGIAPQQGASAITVASLAIARLHREGWLGQVSRKGRSGTSNVGVIRGGDATNVVTPYVQVRAEARSHDPAFRRQIVGAIGRAFLQSARSVRNSAGRSAEVEIDGQLDYEAFKLADDEPCVLAAEAAVRSAGGRPSRAVCNGGLDANWLTARAIPTVTLGSGQQNPHTTDERLELASFRQACRIALRLATGLEAPR